MRTEIGHRAEECDSRAPPPPLRDGLWRRRDVTCQSAHGRSRRETRQSRVPLSFFKRPNSLTNKSNDICHIAPSGCCVVFQSEKSRHFFFISKSQKVRQNWKSAPSRDRFHPTFCRVFQLIFVLLFSFFSCKFLFIALVVSVQVSNKIAKMFESLKSNGITKLALSKFISQSM